jgi:hypothetical protein
MVSTVNTGVVNTGARLDRLPISSFHYRIFWLIGAGIWGIETNRRGLEELQRAAA